MNDRGQVRGYRVLPDGFHWVLWRDATVIDLTARGLPPDIASPGDINRSAQIAGSYY